MARVKLNFPASQPLARLRIPVRITDINYGNHLGNDAMLSILHEARVQLLLQWGLTEMNVGGAGLIMADVMIAYRQEAFYGDVLDIAVYADEISTSSFALLYAVTTLRGAQTVVIAQAKTGMVCYDYALRKIVAIPPELKSRLGKMEI